MAQGQDEIPLRGDVGRGVGGRGLGDVEEVGELWIHWEDKHLYLGGGFKDFLFLPGYLGGNEAILTNMFQMSWFNHQLVI